MLHFKRNRILESHGEYLETASWKAAVEKRLCQNIMEKRQKEDLSQKKKKTEVIN